MDNLQSEILHKIYELPISNDIKSDIQIILEAGFVVLKNELKKDDDEKSRKFQKLENMNKIYEEQLASIRDDIHDFQNYSDFGISALVEAIHRFWEVIETYEKERNNHNSIVPVQAELARLLYTVHNQNREKVTYCKLEDHEYVSFETLVEALKNAVDETILIILRTAEEEGIIDDLRMSKSFNQIGKCAGDLLDLLKILQKKQWKKIDEKLNFDSSEEKLKLLLDNIESRNASETESSVARLVDQFVTAHCNEPTVPFDDARKVIVGVNEIWKKSLIQGHQPLETTINRNQPESRVNLTSELEKPQQNINVPSSSNETSQQLSRKQFIAGSCTETIKYTINNFSKLNSLGEISEAVIVGGFSWKIKLCSGPGATLLCYVFCDSPTREGLQWESTARLKFRVLKQQLPRSYWHSDTQTKQFNSTQQNHVLMIPTNDLRDLRKKTNETMNIELEITLLAEVGISKLYSLSTNKGFDLVNGSIINSMKGSENSTNAKQESKIVKISGLPWLLSTTFIEENTLECVIHCNWKDEKDWSCPARVEISLMKVSSPQIYWSTIIAKEFCKKSSSSDAITIPKVFEKFGFEKIPDGKEVQIIIDVKILIFKKRKN